MVTRLSPRDRQLRDITEKEWSTQVEGLARRLGFDGYHTFRSQRSPAGWPDWAFFKKNRFLLVELKAETGVLTPKQETVLGQLRDSGVEVYVWRPSDLQQVATVLSRRPAHLTSV